MPIQSSDRTQRATDQTAGAARQGAEGLQEQAGAALGASGHLSQEAARRTGENLELMRRLAETMLSGAREAASEVAEWTRQASERQAEATRRIAQARGAEELLEVQDRYIRGNLQALLELSAKVSRLSAEKAEEAGGHLDPGRR